MRHYEEDDGQSRRLHRGGGRARRDVGAQQAHPRWRMPSEWHHHASEGAYSFVKTWIGIRMFVGEVSGRTTAKAKCKVGVIMTMGHTNASGSVGKYKTLRLIASVNAPPHQHGAAELHGPCAEKLGKFLTRSVLVLVQMQPHGRRGADLVPAEVSNEGDCRIRCWPT